MIIVEWWMVRMVTKGKLGIAGLLLGLSAWMAFVGHRLIGASPEGKTAFTEVPAWLDYDEGGHIIGRPDAPVRLILFSDYECPFSRALAAQLRTVLEAWPDEVSVRYRHYPLQNHERGAQAAKAAVCAAEQGHFRELHDLMTIASRKVLRTRSFTIFAHQSGVQDTAQFASCMEANSTQAAVNADLVAGRRLGVPATPTLLVNGRKYAGLPADLDGIVRWAFRDVR